MERKTMKRYLFDLVTLNHVLFQSLAEYVLTLPSSLRLLSLRLFMKCTVFSLATDA